jgi:hypothetical protein
VKKSKKYRFIFLIVGKIKSTKRIKTRRVRRKGRRRRRRSPAGAEAGAGAGLAVVIRRS